MVLGVPATLESASVAILRGRVGLNGLALGSPEGFNADHMFQLAHAHMAVDLWSLRKEEIVVHEVIIDGADFTLEISGAKTNWGTLAEGLQREPPAEDKKGKPIRIDRIVFTHGKVSVAGLPLAGKVSFPLPTVEITEGLSTADGKGVQARKLLAAVVGGIYKSIYGAAKDALPGEEFASIAGEIGSVLGGAEDLLGSVGSATEGAIKGGAGMVQDEAERLKGAVKGILGGTEKEDEDAPSK